MNEETKPVSNAQKEIDKISVVRTLKSDTAEYVKDKDISMIDIAVSESKRKIPEVLQEGSSRNNNLVKIILKSILALVIVGAVAGFFFFRERSEETPMVFPLPKPIIIANYEQEVSLGEANAIFQEDVPISNLLYFPVVVGQNESRRLANVSEFFAVIGGRVPFGLIEGLEDKFMLMMYRTSEKWPILIFEIKSYERIFANINKWEKSMPDDLKEIFGLPSLGSTVKFFYDKEINNHDTRILNDNNGQPILYYSFFNKDYLVITTGEDALKEIFRRLSSTQYLNK